MKHKNIEEHYAILYEKHMRVNKILLKIVCMWPTANEENSLSKKYIRTLLFVNFLLLTGIQAYRAYTVCEELSSCLEILSLSTTCLVIISRIATFNYKKETIRKFNSFNREMWIEELQEEKNQKTMMSIVRTTNTLTLVFFFLTSLCLCNYILMPLIPIYYQWNNGVAMQDMVYNFPFLLGLNFRNPTYNAIIFLYLALTSVFIVCWLSGIDTFYVFAIQYTILHIKLLRQALFLLQGNDNVLRDLRTCIVKHNRIYRNAVLINDIFGPIILSLFIFNTMSMCIVMFNIIIMNSDGNISVIASVSHLIIEIGSVFFYCYFGNKIITESLELSNAIYDVDWYNKRSSELPFCNSIRIMMIRAQNPITITACGFADVSLSTMTNIISTMLSYFAMLKKIYDD